MEENGKHVFSFIFPDFPTDEQDNYFLLCDVLPEDRILREELQKERLVKIILMNEQYAGKTYKISINFFTFYFKIHLKTDLKTIK